MIWNPVRDWCRAAKAQDGGHLFLVSLFTLGFLFGSFLEWLVR
jgi:hypothetical protein